MFRKKYGISTLRITDQFARQLDALSDREVHADRRCDRNKVL